MRINNNLMAMNTHRQLGITASAQSRSMEKLSSGFRINRAGDDAAGLAISEKMRAQIRGLSQASRNAQDGISMIQTTEGAMQEVHSILQRMRELAVQSASDTNSDTDRGQLQKEIGQLKSEIDRISNDTEFNTKKLLDGSIGQSVSVSGNSAVNVVDIAAVTGDLEGTNTITFTTAAATAENFIAGGGIQKTDVTVNQSTVATAGLESGSYTLEISGATTAATAVLKDANGTIVAQTSAAIDSTGGNVVLNNVGTTAAAVTLGANAYNGTDSVLSFDVAITVGGNVTLADGTVENFSGVKANSNSEVTVSGFEVGIKTNLQEAAVTADVTNNGVSFHIGANANQATTVAVNKVDTAALGIDGIDVSTQTGSNAAIEKINDALEKVSTERAKLGAQQNRLEHTIKNLDTSAENLQASESRVRDVDMAKEMMEFSKNNILQQAAQAMLAQANQAPQGVLQLLR